MNNIPKGYALANREVLRDQRIGRRLAFTGAARILAEGAHPIDNRERLARWRNIYSRLPIEATVRRES